MLNSNHMQAWMRKTSDWIMVTNLLSVPLPTSMDESGTPGTRKEHLKDCDTQPKDILNNLQYAKSAVICYKPGVTYFKRR